MINLSESALSNVYVVKRWSYSLFEGGVYDKFFLVRRGFRRKTANSSLARPVLNRPSTQCVNDSPTPPPRPLSRELIAYWMQHPEAMGTVEAMVEWWLLEHRIQHATLELQSVLSELVASGFVIRRREGGGRTYYQLNPEKEAAIIAWLQFK
jgi:hypothetical protein